MSTAREPSKPSPYVSANEVAKRWQCARSSVDRIARRAGLTRVYLGEGRNGMVRYIREEVEAYEHQRRI
jgi:predicted DNA-binding transcriptional regulator AlpA